MPATRKRAQVTRPEKKAALQKQMEEIMLSDAKEKWDELTGRWDGVTLTPEQLAEWKKAAEPVTAAWAEGVKKAGGDPDAVMKDFKATLAKYNSAY